MKIRKALSFDDVLLVPQHNPVTSRDVVDLSTELSDTLSLKIPIIAANMPSICNGEMAGAMANLGGLGIVHRMQTIKEQALECTKGWALSWGGCDIGAAIGVGDDAVERAKACVGARATVLCIDIAHGHTPRVKELLFRLLTEYEEVTVIAGNIATEDACSYLLDELPKEVLGRLVFKVGIGGGSVCTTRIKTGCGVPTFQTVIDTDSWQPIIADGGIRTSGDIVKALAAGADAAMLGGLLAGTDETPGEIVKYYNFDDIIPSEYKRYRGAASEGAKKDFYGKADYIEGAETLVPCKGPVEKVIRDLTQGIRSGMTYCGAKNILELRAKAEFVEITAAGMIESTPHGVTK